MPRGCLAEFLDDHQLFIAARGRRRLPLHDLQVEYADRVEDRDEQQRDKRRDGKPADLCIAERLPQRTPMGGERKESEHGRAHGDEDGTKPHNACIQHSLLEGFTLGMLLFDEIEENNNVADDHTDQADDSQKTHESEGRTHDPQRQQRTNRAKRHRSENDEWLYRILELERERQKDGNDGSCQNYAEIAKSVLLLLFFTANFDLVSRRKRRRD